MLTKVTEVKWLGGHRLFVRFKDGSCGEHDFAEIVFKPGEVNIPLRDPAYFARVYVDHGAPSWPNGYDMAPEWLWREMENAGELHREVAAE